MQSCNEYGLESLYAHEGAQRNGRGLQDNERQRTYPSSKPSCAYLKPEENRIIKRLEKFQLSLSLISPFLCRYLRTTTYCKSTPVQSVSLPEFLQRRLIRPKEQSGKWSWLIHLLFITSFSFNRRCTSLACSLPPRSYRSSAPTLFSEIQSVAGI